MIPSRGGPAPSIHVFAPRAQLRRGVAHHHRTAHLQLAAAPACSIKAEPGYGARGRWRCLAGASRRRAEPHVERVPPVQRALEGSAAVPVGDGEAWPGIETTHPGAAGVEGAGGPGRGAGGRRRGLAGLRDDAPSKARGADGSRAGRRPAAHTAARPIKSGHTAPGTPAAPQATKTPEPEAVPGFGGGGWGIRTPEGLHPTRFPSVRHRPLGESSVHIVPDNHKRKMSSRANPGQWSRSQARHFKEKGITWGPKPTETQTVGPANYANTTRTDAPTAEATAPARGTPASSISRARACRCRRRCQ